MDSMDTHMKTTVEISDALLERARVVAGKENTTMRELIEEGLRRVLVESEKPRSFKLRKASFKGRGLQAGVEGHSMDAIREEIYRGRGS